MLNIIVTVEKNGIFKKMLCDSNILTIEKAKDLVYEFKNNQEGLIREKQILLMLKGK